MAEGKDRSEAVIQEAARNQPASEWQANLEFLQDLGFNIKGRFNPMDFYFLVEAIRQTGVTKEELSEKLKSLKKQPMILKSKMFKKEDKKKLKRRSCFVCKEDGHMAKACPNRQSSFKIGKKACRLCDGWDHWIRDCPYMPALEVMLAIEKGGRTGDQKELPTSERSSAGMKDKDKAEAVIQEAARYQPASEWQAEEKKDPNREFLEDLGFNSKGRLTPMHLYIIVEAIRQTKVTKEELGEKFKSLRKKPMIFNTKMLKRKEKKKTDCCYICKADGHKTKECSYRRGSFACDLCDGRGHWISDCPYFPRLQAVLAMKNGGRIGDKRELPTSERSSAGMKDFGVQAETEDSK